MGKARYIPKEHAIAWILRILYSAKKHLIANTGKGYGLGLCACLLAGTYNELHSAATTVQRDRILNSLCTLMRRHCRPSTPDGIYLWGHPSKATLPLRIKAIDTLIQKVREGDIELNAKRTYR